MRPLRAATTGSGPAASLPGRLLALDVGDRRIGVAVSDPLRVIARPLLTIERGRASADVGAVVRLVDEWRARLVVVGHPLLPSGDRGEQAGRVERFAARLRDALAVPIVLWDESFSTIEATERMKERKAAPASRGQLDAEAAAVILEEWMREHDPSRAARDHPRSDGGPSEPG